VVLPVLACAVGVAGCLVAEQRSSQRGLWLAKPLASATFLWAAFAWGALASPFGRWLAGGLVACALGDVLLISKSAPRAMHAGMLAFGIGHILFTAAFVGYGLVPAATLVAGAASLALVAGVWRWLRPHLALEDRRAVLAYLVVIAGMLACALGAAAGGAPGPAGAGAVLFALSDLAVAQDRFVARSFASTLWGLPAYYAAQLLLAAGAAAP
jgi:uncharacterized membrane protein YhhN